MNTRKGLNYTYIGPFSPYIYSLCSDAELTLYKTVEYKNGNEAFSDKVECKKSSKNRKIEDEEC